MPLLATFLFNVFSAFAVWLAKYLTQKVAVTIAIVTVVTLLFTAFYYAARTIIIAGFAGAATVSPMFAVGISIVISPHSASLVSSYITFWSVVELYKWKVNIIQLWSRTI
jgi:hypothetical protein